MQFTTTFVHVTYPFNLQASSAYWRGNKDRESLQRVYGISYPDQKRLKVIFILLGFSFIFFYILLYPCIYMRAVGDIKQVSL